MQPARSLSALILGALVILGLVACSSGETPGWTYAPPPTPTVAPSTAPSASAGASAGASAAPIGSTAPSASAAASSGASTAPSASVAASAGASGGTAGTTVLNEVALNVQFQTLKLEAPAGQPFQIAFDNQDASIPHNIQIADASGTTVFDGDLLTGPAKTTYDVGALPAGTYKFSCKVHPTVMIGVLTVQ
jgi:plastocyanin